MQGVIDNALICLHTLQKLLERWLTDGWDMADSRWRVVWKLFAVVWHSVGNCSAVTWQFEQVFGSCLNTLRNLLENCSAAQKRGASSVYDGTVPQPESGRKPFLGGTQREGSRGEDWPFHGGRGGGAGLMAWHCLCNLQN